MRAARRFVRRLHESGVLERTERVEAHLYGSLALTGKGHGSDKAILFGLEGETPETLDVDAVAGRLEQIRKAQRLCLDGVREIPFAERNDLRFHRTESLPVHPNGLRFCAFDAVGGGLLTKTYYSIGGGFVVGERTAERDELTKDATVLPFPFRSGAELLRHCTETGLDISGLVRRNEEAFRPEAETCQALRKVWSAMQSCVERGCRRDGILPGGLKVPRRAPKLHRELSSRPEAALQDSLVALDWVSLWAIAVNEENAAGGRVVTAPTNGAAGIVPAVMHYLARVRGCDSDETAIRFLLTAGAIAMLYKLNASISGAEVGCQGEVGVACSMAAGALCEALGGSPAQVENAAEIGMEHNLGLTCDPIGGLVQIPCIERNAMGAVKAITAARLALRGDGQHTVSLDKVIATMRQTGADMSSKYKETSRGGLAVNVTEC
jgi:L-serine dehydratase